MSAQGKKQPKKLEDGEAVTDENKKAEFSAEVEKLTGEDFSGSEDDTIANGDKGVESIKDKGQRSAKESSEDLPQGKKDGHDADEFLLVEDAEGSGEPTAPATQQKTKEGSAQEKNDGEAADTEIQEESILEGGDDYEDDLQYSDEEMDNMESEDYEETAEKSASEEQGLQNMVNKALDSKMQDFQNQMQQMLALIHDVSGKSVGKQGGAGARQEVKQEESLPPEQKTDSNAESSQSKQITPPTPETPEQKQFKEFLGTICSVLEIPISTKEKSFLDETVEGSKAPVVDSLPAEGMIKKSWQKVEGKNLRDFAEFSKFEKKEYLWPLDDMDNYGKIPRVNEDMINHLKKVGKYQSVKLFYGLTRRMHRLHSDFKLMEAYFRYQQRILSYSSYFLAALGKLVKGKDVVDEDTVSELLKYLGKSLIDTCDASVQGCVASARARRRIYVDAMDLPTERINHFEVVYKPLAKELFPPDLESAFKEYNVAFYPEATEDGAKARSAGKATSDKNTTGNRSQPRNAGRKSQEQGNRGQRNRGQGNRVQAKSGQNNQSQGNVGQGNRGQVNRGKGNRRGTRGARRQNNQKLNNREQNRQRQGNRNQGNQRQRTPRQQTSGGARQRLSEPRKRQRRLSDRSQERGERRGYQGQRTPTGVASDVKRRRSNSDLRGVAPKSLPRSGMYSPLDNLLSGYDTVLRGTGRPSALFPTTSSYPLSSDLGGGYYRPSVLSGGLGGYTPAEGVQGSDDDGPIY